MSLYPARAPGGGRRERGGRCARHQRVRAAPGRPERARDRDRHAARRPRRLLRRARPHADDRRPRSRGAPLHALPSRGDGDRAGAPLDSHRPARVPVPRLAAAARARRPRYAGLGADRRRGGHLHERPPQGRLVDRVRDRQPVPGLRVRVRELPLELRPVRARQRPDRHDPPAAAPSRGASSRAGSCPSCASRTSSAACASSSAPAAATGGTSRGPGPRASARPAPRSSRRPRSGARSRWWWTPTSRTSPGRRRAATSTCTATRTTAAPSPA